MCTSCELHFQSPILLMATDTHLAPVLFVFRVYVLYERSLAVLVYRGQSGTLLVPPARPICDPRDTNLVRAPQLENRARHKSKRARHNLKIARDTNLNARATTRKSPARHNSGDPVAGPAARPRSSPDARLRPLPLLPPAISLHCGLRLLPTLLPVLSFMSCQKGCQVFSSLGI